MGNINFYILIYTNDIFTLNPIYLLASVGHYQFLITLFWNDSCFKTNENIGVLYYHLLARNKSDLPVYAFELCIQKGILEVKCRTLSCWRLFRNFRQAEHHPGVNFSEAELAY